MSRWIEIFISTESVRLDSLRLSRRTKLQPETPVGSPSPLGALCMALKSDSAVPVFMYVNTRSVEVDFVT